MKKAFTLIELLVVIAIIAILAAILFPVFAQAKDSAKNSVFLSNMKQTGLGALMYGSDSDDQFPLSWQNTDPTGQGYWSWQGSLQPYTKNWGIFTNPKRTQPHGDNAYWHRLLYMGSLPRAEAINSGATQSTNYSSSFLGKTVKSEGVMGSGGGYGFRDNVPGLSQTAVADPSGTLMVSEGGEFDFWVGVYGSLTPFQFCGAWNGDANVWGGYVIAGPTATTRPKSSVRTGVDGCYIPDGMTTWVATDGSAKAQDYRGRVMETQQLSDGSYVLKRFWPAGY